MMIRKIKEYVSIVDYASYLGYTLKRKGRYYTLVEHDSIMIDPSRNTYWQNSKAGSGKNIGIGGDVIDFACKMQGLSPSEAVRYLAEYGNISTKPAVSKNSTPKKEKVNKALILPPADADNKRVFAYLTKTRFISPQIVNHFIKSGNIYQDENKNCVFVGYDEKDRAVFACRRGTNTYKPFYGDVEGCDYSKCFYIDNCSDTLIVTEAVIDALSVMTLFEDKWKNYNYLAIGGVGKWEAVKTYFSQGKINKVYISLDNDEHGIEAAKHIKECVEQEYSFIEAKMALPTHCKDWNEELKRRKYEL